MTDTTLNEYVSSGTHAARLAFTAVPPTPPSGPSPGYIWYETDTGDKFMQNGNGTWSQINVAGTAATTTEVLTGTDSTKYVSPDALAALWEQGGNITSSSTISIGEGGYFHVTGTTTITDIDFATDHIGRTVELVFDGILTLTHNSSTLILPTGANITTAAGDSCTVVSEGSDVVRITDYQRKDGSALAGGANPTATASDTAVNGTATTFMRSDGAPAIQKTSSSVFGLCKVDNSTITASGGVISAVGSSSAVSLPNGRLTLTSATPVLTTDVTGATTVYYALYNGNQVPISNGSTFSSTVYTELSQATTDNTKSPAACGNNSNYDLFVWSDSGTLRCTRGPAWASDTSRGSGAGTTELERLVGIWTNKVAITNGPGAHLGTYVGTIRTNGTASVDYIMGGAGAAGGESTNLGVWNMYNRVNVALKNFDNTDTWNYSTNSFRIKNNNNANKISFVVGQREDAISARNTGAAKCSTLNGDAAIAIGLNSTTVNAIGSSNTGFVSTNPANAGNGIPTAEYTDLAPLGFNYLAPLEWADSSTTTWFGDNGGSVVWVIFIANINA